MANKIYIAIESAVAWSDAGTGGSLMDAGSLAADAVVCGVYIDLGSGVKSARFKVELLISGFATAPIVGETVDLYFTTSDATTGFDGKPSTDPTSSAEGTVTVAQLPNLFFVGSAVVVSTTAGDDLKVTFDNITFPSRYIAPVLHNNTADALLGTSDAHTVTIRPQPKELQ